MVIHVTNARIPLELKFIAVRMQKDDMTVNMWWLFYIYILFMCGFKPEKREDLKNHVEVVHRDGNYQNCVMCGFKAAMRKDLGSHMETVHKDIYSEGSIY